MRIILNIFDFYLNYFLGHSGEKGSEFGSGIHLSEASGTYQRSVSEEAGVPEYEIIDLFFI